MVESKKRMSLLGLLAFGAGIAAIVLTRIELSGLRTVPIGPYSVRMAFAVAAGGLVLALLALLLASSSRRTGAGGPIVSILVCGAAMGYIAYSQGTGIGARSAAPAAPKQPEPVQTPAPPPPADTASQQQHSGRTIFEDGFPSSASSPQVTQTNPNSAPPQSSGSTNTAAPLIPQGPSRAELLAKVQAARSKLDAARAAVTQSLQSDPVYQDAKNAADMADAQLRQARATYEAGSDELVAASRAALDAHSKLQHIINDAMSKDPDSRQAAQKLATAEAALKH